MSTEKCDFPGRIFCDSSIVEKCDAPGRFFYGASSPKCDTPAYDLFFFLHVDNPVNYVCDLLGLSIDDLAVIVHLPDSTLKTWVSHPRAIPAHILFMFHLLLTSLNHGAGGCPLCGLPRS
ncbi:MAG: hypothetical protein AB1763_08685 [Campylobacterota bacterium]